MIAVSAMARWPKVDRSRWIPRTFRFPVYLSKAGARFLSPSLFLPFVSSGRNFPSPCDATCFIRMLFLSIYSDSRVFFSSFLSFLSNFLRQSTMIPASMLLSMSLENRTNKIWLHLWFSEMQRAVLCHRTHKLNTYKMYPFIRRTLRKWIGWKWSINLSRSIYTRRCPNSMIDRSMCVNKLPFLLYSNARALTRLTNNETRNAAQD